MPIVNSIIVSQTPQADGSLSVHEQHTDHTGRVYDVVYMCQSGLSPDAIMTDRASNLSNEIDVREAELQVATNFEIPLTPVEIMRRLTPAEWAAFQASNDSTIAYFKAIFDKVNTIYRADPLTQAGFNALVTAGILDTNRVAEVLA